LGGVRPSAASSSRGVAGAGLGHSSFADQVRDGAGVAHMTGHGHVFAALQLGNNATAAWAVCVE
jgi:hypothetical protein